MARHHDVGAERVESLQRADPAGGIAEQREGDWIDEQVARNGDALRRQPEKDVAGGDGAVVVHDDHASSAELQRERVPDGARGERVVHRALLLEKPPVERKMFLQSCSDGVLGAIGAREVCLHLGDMGGQLLGEPRRVEGHCGPRHEVAGSLVCDDLEPGERALVHLCPVPVIPMPV